MNRWNFVADMNLDGRITISDTWLWVKWVFFFPGDLLFLMFMGTGIGNFFELSAFSYGGTASGVISLAFWLWCLVVLMYIGLENQRRN